MQAVIITVLVIVLVFVLFQMFKYKIGLMLCLSIYSDTNISPTEKKQTV